MARGRGGVFSFSDIGARPSENVLISGPYIVCLLVILADTLGHHFVLPVLVPYGFLLGASLPVIAIFNTVRFVAVMISMLWMPAFADRYGTKPVLAISLVGSVVAYLLSGLALFVGEPGTTQVATMFVGCGLAGFFGGTSPILQALVAQMSGNNETMLRTRLTMLTVVGNVFPVALMPLAGALSTFGLNLPWLVAAVMTFVILVACMSTFKEPTTPAEEPKVLEASANNEDAKDISSPFADKKLLLLSISSVLCFISVGGFGLVMPMLLSLPSFGLVNPDNLGASRTSIATAFGLVGIPFGCCNLLASSWVFIALCKRLGERGTLLLGIVCGSSALVAHGFARNMLEVAALQALLGCGVGLIIPGFAPIVSKWALYRFPTRCAQAQAVPGIGSMLGMMLGPIILSIVIGGGSRAEIQLTFLVAAAFPLFGLLLLIFVSVRIDRELKIHKRHKEEVSCFDVEAMPEEEFIDSMCEDLRAYLTQDDNQYRNFIPSHHLEQNILLRALDAAFPQCPSPDAATQHQKHLAFTVNNFWHLLTLEDKIALQNSSLDLDLPQHVQQSLRLSQTIQSSRLPRHSKRSFAGSMVGGLATWS